jgi:hypothetical protein
MKLQSLPERHTDFSRSMLLPRSQPAKHGSWLQQRESKLLTTFRPTSGGRGRGVDRQSALWIARKRRTSSRAPPRRFR